jgi:hypothetical protein
MRYDIIAFGEVLWDIIEGVPNLGGAPLNFAAHAHRCGMDAAIGGGMMLSRWLRTEPSRRMRRVWLVLLIAPLVAIGTGLVLHAVHLVPFAPWVPTAQKGVILSFAAWIFGLAVRPLSVRGRCVAGLGWFVPLMLALALFVRPSPRLVLEAEDATPVAPEVLPLSEDELAGLAWLEYVTGPLSEAGGYRVRHGYHSKLPQ